MPDQNSDGTLSRAQMHNILRKTLLADVDVGIDLNSLVACCATATKSFEGPIDFRIAQ
jgi:hypothetical protein